jgi:hypothetical protein
MALCVPGSVLLSRLPWATRRNGCRRFHHAGSDRRPCPLGNPKSNGYFAAYRSTRQPIGPGWSKAMSMGKPNKPNSRRNFQCRIRDF